MSKPADEAARNLNEPVTEQQRGESKAASPDSIIVHVAPAELAARISSFLGIRDLSNLIPASTKWQDFSIREHLREKAELVRVGFILTAENIRTMQLPDNRYTVKHTDEQVERLYQAAFGATPVISAEALLGVYETVLQRFQQTIMADNPQEFVLKIGECIRHEDFYSALRENLLRADDMQMQYAMQVGIAADQIPLWLIDNMDIALIKMAFSKNGLVALRENYLDTKDFNECYDKVHLAVKEKILGILLSDAGIQAMRTGGFDTQGFRLWTRASLEDVNYTNFINGIGNLDLSTINSVADLQTLITQTQQANQQQPHVPRTPHAF